MSIAETNSKTGLLVSPEHRYDCFNKDPGVNNTPMEMQSGWTDDGRRIMVNHQPAFIAMDCGHHLSHTDPSCSGCKWRVNDG